VSVGGALIVLAPVSLDHQPVSRAGEIDNEPADWMLPAKFIALQSAITQRRP
jgi:hypothetical protein